MLLKFGVGYYFSANVSLFFIKSPPERRPLLFVVSICLFAFGITQFAIATWLDEYFDGGNSGAYAIWWGFYNGIPQLMSFFLNPVNKY